MASAQPDVLGRNGTFNAFRVLKQDAVGFEKYLDQAASHLLLARTRSTTCCRPERK